MREQEPLHNMSIERIKSVIDIVQKASDAYLFILDLTSDVYLIPESMTKRFALDSTRIENCTEALVKIIHPSDYAMLAEDITNCRTGKQDKHNLEYRFLVRNNRVVWI